jgi:hypothetical protein
MLSQFLDRVGDYNPQLLRELKGRLIPRNIYLVIGFSLILQTLIIIVAQEPQGTYWIGVFQTLHHLIPLILLPTCVYLLSVDLIKEEQRGTLNFIRLTPQPSTNILIGKILGVPALIFLGGISLIPLHFVAGLYGDVNGAWLIGIYLFWGLSIALFSTIAIGMIQNAAVTQQLIQKQNILNGTAAFSGLGSFFIASGYCAFFNLFLGIYQEDFILFKWFFLPVGGNFILGYLWLMVTIAGLTYGCWVGINRRFRNTNHSLYTKAQSYIAMAALQLWFVGFFFPVNANANFNNSPQVIGLFWVSFACPILLLLLNQAITPSRQYLLEWARYRQLKELWPDLLWAEKSPTVVALGINIAIVIGVWSLWLLALPSDFFDGNPQTVTFGFAWLMCIFTMVAVWIYGLISQWLLMVIKPQRSMKVPIETQATFTTVMVMGIPTIVALVTKVPLFWAFTPFPALMLISGSKPMALVLLGLQLTLGILTFKNFNACLKRIGQSETKDLLTSSNLTRFN